MITHLDHVGIVAHSLEESLAVLVDQLGLERDTERTPYPKGGYFAPERTKIFFVKVNLGETRIEILLPEDNESGIGRFLERRGAGLHHLGYGSTDVVGDTKLFMERGLSYIDFGGPIDEITASFFHPKTADGILTEIVPDRRPQA
ncbi:MAG: hypothetical protein F4038_05780 [Chloroflexi bacterium]|nr:VOC family protein [Chloroflexota bacterium]MCY3587951.1 VOC family protein [Chloroflexota bacterium]MCY3686265.1 VOC family protein [Chloroflexota bacterium]MDE2708886.1 VOC family protein [Chloroflexota bacterium]MDE2987952.1 VOC family protein [Chloroflexota bacterium]